VWQAQTLHQTYYFADAGQYFRRVRAPAQRARMQPHSAKTTKTAARAPRGKGGDTKAKPHRKTVKGRRHAAAAVEAEEAELEVLLSAEELVSLQATTAVLKTLQASCAQKEAELAKLARGTIVLVCHRRSVASHAMA